MTRHEPVEGHVNHVMVEERAADFTKRSIKSGSKLQGLRLAFSMLDLTTLEGKDTVGKVRALCHKALHPAPERFGVGADAAVCVYPRLVAAAKSFLKGSPVKVAAVAACFPSGQSSFKTKLEDTREALRAGADEIDMVIDRGAFLQGELAKVQDEIAAVKELCGDARLKVILETGELVTYDNVQVGSMLAMQAGADFIKTSTGKVSPSATLPATLVMLEAIREFYFSTGVRVGIKPAGGIRTANHALQYLVMVNETLGDDWLTPEMFRIGASTLANDILMQVAKCLGGAYQSSDYFSLP
jgi:deoxyribose-phosphate aldolase